MHAFDPAIEAADPFGAFAACLAYEASADDRDGACLWCGWLADDHPAEAPVRTPAVIDLEAEHRRAS
ncbi:MAG: hypothetical protein ACOYNI_03005 [Acidimicrobiia bacterium]